MSVKIRVDFSIHIQVSDDTTERFMLSRSCPVPKTVRSLLPSPSWKATKEEHEWIFEGPKKEMNDFLQRLQRMNLKTC